MPVYPSTSEAKGPLSNERLHLMVEDGAVTLEFKRPWKDGTRSISLEAKALLSRLSAIVPAPRRHVTVYSGVAFAFDLVDRSAESCCG
ncbi:MAG: transposase [Fibrobacteria bacterium]